MPDDLGPGRFPEELPLQALINLRMQCLDVVARSIREDQKTLPKVLEAAEFLADWLQGKAKAADYKARLQPDVVTPA